MAKKKVQRTSTRRARAKRTPSPAPVKSRPPGADAIFERVTRILDEARASVVRSVNSAVVLAYWQIGREIVETLQRAATAAAATASGRSRSSRRA